MHNNLGHLPHEPADRVTQLFSRFLRIESMAGIALLFAAIIAIILSNSPWSEQFFAFWEIPIGITVGKLEVTRTLKHWINDGLMTLFFFVVALELKRELVLGELRNFRVAALPVFAAIGGMVMPATIFLLVMGGREGVSGWGTVMSTDTAFVIGCLAILGKRIPYSLRLFLLSLAIFDDIGAILIVAAGYGDDLNWMILFLVAGGLLIVNIVARLGIRSIPVYSLLGITIWVGFDLSGVHATLAGVILGLMTPARSWVSDLRLHAIFNRVVAYPPGEHWSSNAVANSDLRRAGLAAREVLSPLERIETSLHPWVAFTIMPIFALANAGVPFGADGYDNMLAAAIFLAFVIGKPLGVVLFCLIALKSRVAIRPVDLTWGLLAAGSLLTGIGFTMALFIAQLAFDVRLLQSVKIGILSASTVSAMVGFLVLFWLTTPHNLWLRNKHEELV